MSEQRAHPSDDVISLYHDGEGPREMLADVEAHVAQCAECRRTLEKMRNLSHALRVTHENGAPAGFTAAVAERIRANAPSPDPKPQRPPFAPRAHWFGLAAAVLLCAIGTYIVVTNQHMPTVEVARVPAESMRSGDAAPPAKKEIAPGAPIESKARGFLDEKELAAGEKAAGDELAKGSDESDLLALEQRGDAGLRHEEESLDASRAAATAAPVPAPAEPGHTWPRFEMLGITRGDAEPLDGDLLLYHWRPVAAPDGELAALRAIEARLLAGQDSTQGLADAGVETRGKVGASRGAAKKNEQEKQGKHYLELNVPREELEGLLALLGEWEKEAASAAGKADDITMGGGQFAFVKQRDKEQRSPVLRFVVLVGLPGEVPAERK